MNRKTEWQKKMDFDRFYSHWFKYFQTRRKLTAITILDKYSKLFTHYETDLRKQLLLNSFFFIFHSIDIENGAPE